MSGYSALAAFPDATDVGEPFHRRLDTNRSSHVTTQPRARSVPKALVLPTTYHWELLPRMFFNDKTAWVCGALGIVVLGLLGGCESSKSGAASDNGTAGASETAGAAGTAGIATSAGGSASNCVGTSANAPAVDPQSVIGNFSIQLNPAVGSESEYTSINGAVYGFSYPTEIVETVKIKNSDCAVYAYSLNFCDPACTSAQVCVGGTEGCRDLPTPVSVGDVTVSGIGDGPRTLSRVSNKYTYALSIAYPGFEAGDTLKLSASGDCTDAFDIETKGVSPVVLSESSYELNPASDFVLNWAPQPSASDARVTVLLNLSKHGGSAGYLKCEVADTGTLTIPAAQLASLVGLGVSGYPSLLVTRSSVGQAVTPQGTITFDVTAIAKPSFEVQGSCSCFDDSDCASCGDTSKTVCDSVTKLCHAP